LADATSACFPKDNLAFFNRGRSIAELVTSHLGSRPTRILDVGAGSGHVLHALGERHADAARVAIESSNECQRGAASFRSHMSSHFQACRAEART
jgi:trans-aconitate methyltransferase